MECLKTYLPRDRIVGSKDLQCPHLCHVRSKEGKTRLYHGATTKRRKCWKELVTLSRSEGEAEEGGAHRVSKFEATTLCIGTKDKVVSSSGSNSSEVMVNSREPARKLSRNEMIRSSVKRSRGSSSSVLSSLLSSEVKGISITVREKESGDVIFTATIYKDVIFIATMQRLDGSTNLWNRRHLQMKGLVELRFGKRNRHKENPMIINGNAVLLDTQYLPRYFGAI